jgi:hypothetical protein
VDEYGVARRETLLRMAITGKRAPSTGARISPTLPVHSLEEPTGLTESYHSELHVKPCFRRKSFHG